METVQGMTIKAHVSPAVPALFDWLRKVLLHPAVAIGFPDEQRTEVYVQHLYWRIARGEVAAVIPSVDGRLAGVYLAVLASGGMAVGHQAILPPYRMVSAACMRQALAAGFAGIEGLDFIMGFTPRNNPAACAAAIAGGMQRIGWLPPCGGEPERAVFVAVRPDNEEMTDGEG